MKTKSQNHAHKKDTTVPYKATKSGMWWYNKNKDQWVHLSNFKARIRTDITKDDGARTEHLYELELTLDRVTNRFSIEASKFQNMQWVSEQGGAAATISAGYTIKDNLRAAIQSVSIPIPTQTVYSHLGWRRVDGKWLYLHAGGAIGDSVMAKLGVRVNLNDLDSYSLPTPPTSNKLKSAIRASLSILDVAPAPIAYGLLAATYRAPFGEVLPCDFSLFFVGQSGCQKSELTALSQAHFGRTFNRLNLPANWTYTANALEKKAFLAKDAIMTIDDLVPLGSAHDVAALHLKADRVLRGQGNQHGRGRMTASCELTKDYYPRGLILSSGEDVPKGHSLGARLLTVEMKKGDINLDKLTELQEDAKSGKFATAMAGYILWLGSRLDELKIRLPKRRDELRSELRKAKISHDRTPDNIASLALGLEMFLMFAAEQGAIDAKELERLVAEGLQALRQLGEQQREQHTDTNPAEVHLRLLRAAIASGRCHLKDKNGAYADDPAIWGWREIVDNCGQSDWRSEGDCIGWTDGDDVYLEPTASYRAAQLMGGNGAGALTIGLKTLNKRLKDAGMLATTDEKRGTSTIRKVLQDQQREVLHLHKATFWDQTTGE
jgi:hypothetical protein